MLKKAVLKIVCERFADQIVKEAGFSDPKAYIETGRDRIVRMDDFGDYIGSIVSAIELYLVMMKEGYSDGDVDKLFFGGDDFALMRAHGLKGPKSLRKATDTFAQDYLRADDLTDGRREVRGKLMTALGVVGKIDAEFSKIAMLSAAVETMITMGMGPSREELAIAGTNFINVYFETFRRAYERSTSEFEKKRLMSTSTRVKEAIENKPSNATGFMSAWMMAFMDALLSLNFGSIDLDEAIDIFERFKVLADLSGLAEYMDNPRAMFGEDDDGDDYDEDPEVPSDLPDNIQDFLNSLL